MCLFSDSKLAHHTLKYYVYSNYIILIGQAILVLSFLKNERVYLDQRSL